MKLTRKSTGSSKGTRPESEAGSEKLAVFSPASRVTLRLSGVTLEEEKNKLSFSLLSWPYLSTCRVNLILNPVMRQLTCARYYNDLILFSHSLTFGMAVSMVMDAMCWCKFWFFSSSPVPSLSCHWFVTQLCSPAPCYLLITLLFLWSLIMHCLVFQSSSVSLYSLTLSLK